MLRDTFLGSIRWRVSGWPTQQSTGPARKTAQAVGQPHSNRAGIFMDKLLIGCCGAFCGTCQEYEAGRCRGCKIGYASGERELCKARCPVKVCCIHKLGAASTCADCPENGECTTLQDFQSKKGYKYEKYKEALQYIKQYGYSRFMAVASGWKRPYGKY
jgi:hypothetical protein